MLPKLFPFIKILLKSLCQVIKTNTKPLWRKTNKMSTFRAVNNFIIYVMKFLLVHVLWSQSVECFLGLAWINQEKSVLNAYNKDQLQLQIDFFIAFWYNLLLKQEKNYWICFINNKKTNLSSKWKLYFLFLYHPPKKVWLRTYSDT